MSQYNIGDIVRINQQEYTKAHGQLATIVSFTDWGAHCTWNGGSGKVRLFFQEMTQTVSTGNECKLCGSINIVRAGSCILCRDCGDTSGGCG